MNKMDLIDKIDEHEKLICKLIKENKDLKNVVLEMKNKLDILLVQQNRANRGY